MKTLTLAALIAVMTLSSVQAAGPNGRPEENDAMCYDLYHKSWHGMTTYEKMLYVIYCKPRGWN